MGQAADSVEALVERARADAGADFAFVLSMMGRLVTQRAPRDMPEEGRLKLVTEARGLVGSHRVGLTSMPREELVPYGGAAPVDIYVGVAAEHAILCVVMASWADQARAPGAVAAALDALEAVLARGAKKPSARPKRKDRPSTMPKRGAQPEAASAAQTSAPTGMAAGVPAAADTRAPAGGAASALATETSGSTPGAGAPTGPRRRGAMTGLVMLTGSVAQASSRLRDAPKIGAAQAPPAAPPQPGHGSMPSIVVGEAELGRESLLAVQAEQRAAALPPGGARSGSTPDVRVELASIGRTTELELRAEEARRMQSLPEASDPVLGAAARMTQPWVEPATATKRAVDAAATARKKSPPKVTLKLEEPDPEELEAILAADFEDAAASEPEPGDGAPRPPKPSLDVWHDALSKTLEPDGER